MTEPVSSSRNDKRSVYERVLDLKVSETADVACKRLGWWIQNRSRGIAHGYYPSDEMRAFFEGFEAGALAACTPSETECRTDERPGRIAALEATRLNAEYWKREADKLNVGAAEKWLCLEQAINAWKNAAYAAHDKLAACTPSAEGQSALADHIEKHISAQRPVPAAWDRSVPLSPEEWKVVCAALRRVPSAKGNGNG